MAQRKETARSLTIVSLGDLWPNMSMMLMPHEVMEAIKHVIRKMNPSTLKMDDSPEWRYLREVMFEQHPGVAETDETIIGLTKPSIENVFIPRLKRWKEGGASYSEQAVEDLSALEVVPGYRDLTISNIYYDIERNEVESIDFPNLDWRWRYHQFAYTVFWALLFHVPNVYLRYPHEIFCQTCLLFEDIHSDICEIDSEVERKRHKRAFELAIYERLVGAEYDIAQRLPHYVQNIERRFCLSQDERLERVELFGRAVQWLKNKFEELLWQK